MRIKSLALGLSTCFVFGGSTAYADSNYKECGVIDGAYKTEVISELSIPQRRAGANTIAIRGGEFASISEMPGLVNLTLYSSYVTDPNGEVIYATKESCGATRISRDLILTAAHCLQSDEVRIEINYGASNILNEKRGIAVVNSVVCHGGFEQVGGGLYNDIALIDISDPNLADLRANVVPFATFGHDTLTEATNIEDLIVTGWGTSSHDEDPNDPINYFLKKGKMRYHWHGPSNILVSPSGEPYSSICSGDSGGPLYYEDGEEKIFVGIVSAQLTSVGRQQCQDYNNALFTSISGFKSWVEDYDASLISDEFHLPDVALKLETDEKPLINDIDKEVQSELRDLALRAAQPYVLRNDFENFKKDVYKEPFSDGMYIVNGDVPIPPEDIEHDIEYFRIDGAKDDDKFLKEFYYKGLVAQSDEGDGYLYSQASYKGYEVKWPDNLKKKLTYCVSTKFGKRYELVKDTIKAATSAWEEAADVKFVHVPSEDLKCDNKNNRVIFDIRPIDSDGEYLARAFFPHYPRKYRNVLIDYRSFLLNPNNGPGLEGVMRHELGHVLGARHEHTRPESGVCFEDNDYISKTGYDRYSCMHYPQCNGYKLTKLELTPLDKNGVACVYGAATGFDHDSKTCL